VLQSAYDDNLKRFTEDRPDMLRSQVILADAQAEAGEFDAAINTYERLRKHVNTLPFDVRRNALMLESRLTALTSPAEGIAILQSMLGWSATEGNLRALDASERSNACRRIGEILLADRKARDALTWFAKAESELQRGGAAPPMVAARIDWSRSIAHLQLGEFETAFTKLSSVHSLHAKALGDANPRTLAVGVYKAIADDGRSAPEIRASKQAGVAAGPLPKAERAFALLKASYSAPKRMQGLSDWLASSATSRQWAHLPVCMP
jgi:tetratricopeptide (TPR) repeat protein